jgi:Zn-dependent M28 family amino/carboxypeptidase
MIARSLACAALAAALFAAAPVPAGSAGSPEDVAWSGTRAMDDIARQLAFGPRNIDSEGHEKTIEFIVQSLAQTPATVTRESWTDAGGATVHHLTNLIARFNPANPERILLGTHYDSIVRAYRDVASPNAPMPGANNSASGVALLLETARSLSAAAVPPALGVDLVFFDGEEGPISLGAGDPHWVPLGSPYFARHIDEFYPKRQPVGAVLFDMVCYRSLKLYPESSSVDSAPKQVAAFWSLGASIAPQIFRRTAPVGPIYDDQIALAQRNIPSFLVIGFEYEPWFNTTRDTLDKCSPGSLEAVGRTLVRYVYRTGGGPG